MDLNERIAGEAAPDLSDDTADASNPAAALKLWHDMQRSDGAEERRTILVVDDDAVLRMLLRATLERVLEGFDIVTVPGPIEALAFLADGAGRTAKVFTDNQMPGMTGVDFARVLRGDLSDAKLSDAAVAELRRVPISLVTGDEDTAEADSLRMSGTLHAVVKKPFTIKDIVQGVTVAVNRLREIQVTA